MNFSEEITTFHKARYETKIIQIVDVYCGDGTNIGEHKAIASLLAEGWGIAGVAGGINHSPPLYDNGQTILTTAWLIVLEREIYEGPPMPKPVEGTTVG